MRSQAVIGCGFGDEGKGRVVDYLCSHQPDSLVVRFSGGQQAGHQVITETQQHVFSNFGSGTLQGVPTYWSKHCTIDPTGIINELSVLIEKKINPILYIDERCAVTTIFDKIYNQFLNSWHGHGTCGVGFGQTHQREEDRYSLLFADLFNPSIFRIKLDMIQRYYSHKITIGNIELDSFIKDCQELVKIKNVQVVYNLPPNYDPYIFEGSQGLLLDQNFGFFPHVSRTNTGSKNILEMEFKPHVFLVTRAYQTRHGNGPMTNEQFPHNIKLNPFEQNFDDEMQGRFRTTLLDLDLLKYAINKDKYIRTTQNRCLVITCLDLIDEYRFTTEGIINRCLDESGFINKIITYLNIDNIYLSRIPTEEIEASHGRDRSKDDSTDE